MATRPVQVTLYPGRLESMLDNKEAQALVLKAAKAGADAARSTTPDVTGEHVADITYGVSADEDGVAVAWFGSKSRTWHLIEFGSVNNPAYRSLTRAAERIGLKFYPKGR